MPACTVGLGSALSCAREHAPRISISAIPGDTPRLPLGPTALPGTYTHAHADGKSFTAPFVVKMDRAVKTSAAGLEKQFQLETRLASLLSRLHKRLSRRDRFAILAKVEPASHGAVHDSVQASKQLVGILGAPAGFAAPPANESLSPRGERTSRHLVRPGWQVDAEPTTSQSAAVAATEHDAQDVMQRWDALRTVDLPASIALSPDANLPEVKIDADRTKKTVAWTRNKDEE